MNPISPHEKEIALKRILSLAKDLGRELNLNPRGLENISRDSMLDKDLGFDSLGRVELISRIERTFKISLPEEKYSIIDTPGHLLEEILKSGYGSKIDFDFNKKVKLIKEASEFIPYSNCSTLIEVLKWHVQYNPDRLHVKFYSDDEFGKSISYVELYQKALTFATSLQKIGLVQGERVALMLPTCPEYLYSFLGVMLAGAIPVPVYPPIRMSQLREHLSRHERIFKNADVVYLITTHGIKAIGSLLQDKVESIRKVLTPLDLSQSTEVISAHDAKASQIAFLQYTSGSTGDPKGVSLTHHNLLSNLVGFRNALKIKHTDVVISWLPLYHDMGLIGTWLCSLCFGAPLVLMTPLQFLNKPERWLWAFHRYGGTVSTAPNFAYELCLKRIRDEYIESLDLSSCRFTLNGAEPVSPRTLSRFIERFQDYGFKAHALLPAYGLAENSVALTIPPLERRALTRFIDRDVLMKEGEVVEVAGPSKDAMEVVSCGIPLEKHSIRIVDDQDNPLGEKRVGSIQFKGPSATQGYFRNQSKTNKLYHGEWLDTGDIGVIIDGEIYITGRVKDIIIKAGRNIAPQELEEVVGDLKDVRKGCVVSISVSDSESGTEKLVIVCETSLTDSILREELVKRINVASVDLLGTTADDVCLVPPQSVLKTSSGKVRRVACRDKYLSGDYKKGLISINVSSMTSWFLLSSSFITSKIKKIISIFFGIIYFFYVWPIVLIFFPFIWIWIVIMPGKIKWKGIQWGVRALLAFTFIPLKVHGMEKLKDSKEKFLFISNHSSYLDGPLLAAILLRSVSFVAKQEFLKNPLMRMMLAPLGTVFVDRQNQERIMKQFKIMKKKIHVQHPELFFFPEGTFTADPGLKTFHMGAFLIAVELNLKVLPITIKGTRKVLNDNANWLPIWGGIEIFLHDPIDTHSVIKDFPDKWEAASEIRNLAREVILADLKEPDLAIISNSNRSL